MKHIAQRLGSVLFREHGVGPGTIVLAVVVVSMIVYGALSRFYSLEAAGVPMDISCPKCGAGRNLINLYDPNGYLETAECQRCFHRWKLE